MAQEDKFKKEIDRIGLVLAKLLGMLLNKKDHPQEAVQDVMQQTYDELGIDIEQLLAVTDGDDIDFLVNNKKFSTEHLKHFGDLLYELARYSNAQQQKLLLAKAMNIYRYISAHARTLYLDIEYRLKDQSDINPHS